MNIPIPSMLRTAQAAMVATLAVVTSLPVGAADAWDQAGDATPGATQNVLWHTAPAQRHDLANTGGTADQDWFKVFPRANRSYEVQVVNVTVNMGSGFAVTRTDSIGGLLETSTGLDPAGTTRALRWMGGSVDAEQRVLVAGTAASTASAQYDIQLRETTLYCPRFNNTGSQTSVLILQRTSTETGAGACQSMAFFYDEDAALIAPGYAQSFLPNDMSAVGTLGVTGPTKGALHVAHTCGVGGLKGKLVALEPATGFSFDTPCTERER